MTLAWLVAQLVFWLGVMGAIIVSAAVVILAPPYFAGRYLWHRSR